MHSKKITVRFASAVSAAVIGFTSTAISFFDCPVYAAYGGAAWGEFFGFYSLLEGFGFGQDNTEFINSVDNWIDSLQPEEKPREDYDGEWMTDAQYWQQCQYDKFTGWLDNLVDSWSESYDAVGDVGSGGASGGSADSQYFKLLSSGVQRFLFHNSTVVFSLDSSVKDYGTSGYSYGNDDFVFTTNISDIPVYFYYCTSNSTFYCIAEVPSFVTLSNAVICNKQGLTLNWRSLYQFSIGDTKYIFSSGFNSAASQMALDIFSAHGINIVRSDMNVSDFVKSDVYDATIADPGKFVGPVYTYPAAQELARQNKTSTGIRLDVKTSDGVPDVKAALDGAGVSTVDELAASVAAGDVAMQDVFADAKVTPYVVADTTTGVVVTDLGVAADAAGVKPVALTKQLTVPADLTNAATYAIQGKTWDPDMAKYRLPLFQYFPFCLPWDIYQVLNSFAADPVAPQIEIPIGKFFANKKSFDGSAVANYTETLDLGDEKFSKWFSALRLLESAGIIIGLVLISVHLIHGGR